MWSAKLVFANKGQWSIENCLSQLAMFAYLQIWLSSTNSEGVNDATQYSAGRFLRASNRYGVLLSELSERHVITAGLRDTGRGLFFKLLALHGFLDVPTG